MGCWIFEKFWVSCLTRNLSLVLLHSFSLTFLSFICLKRLNYLQRDCADFKARFCCPKVIVERAFLQSSFKKSPSENNNSRQRREQIDLFEPLPPLPISIEELRNFIKLFYFITVSLSWSYHVVICL